MDCQKDRFLPAWQWCDEVITGSTSVGDVPVYLFFCFFMKAPKHGAQASVEVGQGLLRG